MNTKVYVNFYMPGSFFSEESTLEVSADLRNSPMDVVALAPRSAFAFSFFDVKETEVDGEILRSRRVNVSGRYYIGGRVMTLEDVRRDIPNSRILQDNMTSNGWIRVIRCKTNNIQPLEDDDTVLDVN